MSLALGIPVAADLNLVPGDAAQVAYTNGDGVNVRVAPGFGAGILNTLHEGVQLTVVDGPVYADDGSGWYLISADTSDGVIDGWVVADYVSGDPGAVSYADTSSGEMQVQSVSSAVVVNTDGTGLRLRDGATFAAGVMTVMPEGASVTVVGGEQQDAEGNAWLPVEFEGMSGYAAAAYLSIGGSAGAPDDGQRTAEEPATEEPSTDESVSEDPDAASLSVGDRAAVYGTGGGGLNMRGEPSYGAAVITIVDETQVVTVIDGPIYDDYGNGWYQVDYSSMVGWMHGGYLSWTDAAPSTDPSLGSTNEEPPAEEPAAEEPVAEPPAQEPVAEEPPAEAPVAPETGIGSLIVAEALNYVGVPYVWGGTTPSGWDCSGYTYYIVNSVTGMGLSRALEVQAVTGSYVDYGALAAGDLVFFQNTYRWGLSHVGIYIGGGQFVHASSERTGTIISNMSDSYWGPRYYTARRVA